MLTLFHLVDIALPTQVGDSLDLHIKTGAMKIPGNKRDKAIDFSCEILTRFLLFR
jgi:hypothetical protein